MIALYALVFGDTPDARRQSWAIVGVAAAIAPIVLFKQWRRR